MPCAGITTRGSPYSLLISTDRDEHEGTWNYKNAHDKNLIQTLLRSLRYYYEKGIMQKVAGGWAKENQ